MRKKFERLQQRIEKVRGELLKIGYMRPGTLSRQYRNPREKKGGFFQLSYTYKMKSRTEYVRPETVQEVKKQIVNYKRFKLLTGRWIDLAMEQARLKLEMDRKK